MRQVFEAGWPKPTLVAAACAVLLAACGGSDGDGANSGGKAQQITFPYVGGNVNILANTVKLTATATSGLPVTYASATPSACSVSGDQLTVLTAGSECSVVASQSGGADAKGVTWAAADDLSQLFVVTKVAQAVGMINPGWQPLDAQTFSVTATSSAGRPIRYSTSTPAVCAVQGNTVTKLANGQCAITAEAGDAFYATASVTKTIPIGTATAPLLTFASGYKDIGSTAELGKLDISAGVNIHGWYCGGAPECGTSLVGTSTTYHPKNGGAAYEIFPAISHFFHIEVANPSDIPSWGWYFNYGVRAPGLADVSNSGNTNGGVVIDSQAALIIHDVSQNEEWFNLADNKINVDVVLGWHVTKADGGGCNLKLRGAITPTSSTAATYTVSLKDLQFQESCGLPFTSADAWNVIQLSNIVQGERNPERSQLDHQAHGPERCEYFPTELTVGAIAIQ